MNYDPLADHFRPQPTMLDRFMRFCLKVAAGVAAFFVLFAVIFYFGVKADDQRQVAEAAAAKGREAEIQSAIAAKKVAVGMTQQQVVAVMGYPRDRTESGGVGRQVTLWHYDDATLTFVDGGLTRWAFSR